MLDTKAGTAKKQAADEVARIGFEAMMRGDGDVVAGWQNKVQAALAHMNPSRSPRRVAPQAGGVVHGIEVVTGDHRAARPC